MTHPMRYLPVKAQKPVRGALLNRSHPLARNMIACFLLNELSGEQITNLADMAPDVGWNTENGYFPGWKVGALDLPHQTWISLDLDAFTGLGASDYTLIAKIYWNGNDRGENTILSFDNYDPAWYLDGGSTHLRIYDEGYRDFSDFNLIANTWYVVGFRRGYTGNDNYFVDGVKDAFSHGHTGDTYSLDNPTTVRLGWNGYSSTADFFDGIIECLYFWKRCLTDEEVAWVSREPYCMF